MQNANKTRKVGDIATIARGSVSAQGAIIGACTVGDTTVVTIRIGENNFVTGVPV